MLFDLTIFVECRSGYYAGQIFNLSPEAGGQYLTDQNLLFTERLLRRTAISI